MVLSLAGILLIMGSWRWAVCHLYTLPTPALAGFVSLTANAFYVVGSIVIFMVTGRLVYEWRVGTEQVQQVSSMSETIKQEITGIRSPKDFSDDAPL